MLHILLLLGLKSKFHPETVDLAVISKHPLSLLQIGSSPNQYQWPCKRPVSKFYEWAFENSLCPFAHALGFSKVHAPSPVVCGSLVQIVGFEVFLAFIPL